MHRKSSQLLQPDAPPCDGGNRLRCGTAVRIEIEKEKICAQLRSCGARLNAREVHLAAGKLTEDIVECPRPRTVDLCHQQDRIG